MHPLTDAQKDSINDYNVVYRCNHIPTYREGDKINFLTVNGSTNLELLFSKQISSEFNVLFFKHDFTPTTINEQLEDIKRRIKLTYKQLTDGNFIIVDDWQNIYNNIFHTFKDYPEEFNLANIKKSTIFDSSEDEDDLKLDVKFSNGFRTALYAVDIHKSKIDLYGFSFMKRKDNFFFIDTEKKYITEHPDKFNIIKVSDIINYHGSGKQSKSKKSKKVKRRQSKRIRKKFTKRRPTRRRRRRR
jgi:hypothetical protein